MPTHLSARPPLDAFEERQVRKLTRSVHAPADWIVHAEMVARSWDGLRTRQIAQKLGCHPQTVRERLQAFDERGLDGLGTKPGAGRRPRLTQLERSTILALVQLPPPDKPTHALTSELIVNLRLKVHQPITAKLHRAVTAKLRQEPGGMGRQHPVPFPGWRYAVAGVRFSSFP